MSSSPQPVLAKSMQLIDAADLFESRQQAHWAAAQFSCFCYDERHCSQSRITFAQVFSVSPCLRGEMAFFNGDQNR